MMKANMLYVAKEEFFTTYGFKRRRRMINNNHRWESMV